TLRYVIWSGDLNFRVRTGYVAIVAQRVDRVLTASVPGRGDIRFPPTLSSISNSDVYDTSNKQRVPSYTGPSSLSLQTTRDRNGDRLQQHPRVALLRPSTRNMRSSIATIRPGVDSIHWLTVDFDMTSTSGPRRRVLSWTVWIGRQR
uniref:IPPc domain-containing protein n=1 Tax=Macrostomum lignano TaxID=282301 RepID=A0A1I8FC55_9PLAT